MNKHRKEKTVELYKEIGIRIAQFRKESNLTQAQLAEKLGINQQVLATYELAQRRIPIYMLQPIATALSVGVEDLLSLNIKNKPGPMSKLERRIEFIKKLPEDKQKKILELIDSAIDIATSKT